MSEKQKIVKLAKEKKPLGKPVKMIVKTAARPRNIAKSRCGIRSDKAKKVKRVWFRCWALAYISHGNKKLFAPAGTAVCQASD